MSNRINIRKVIRKSGRILIWTVLIWAALLIAVQAVLSSGIAERVISGYAEEHIDGTTSLGSLKISVFRHFPNIGLSVNDFSITYPSDRFVSPEADDPGIGIDTLAAFDRLSVSINFFSLAAGKIHIPFADIVSPRIFARRYQDGQVNWDILKFPSDSTTEVAEEKKETTIPQIRLGRIGMSGHPYLEYTDGENGAALEIDRFVIRGHRRRIGLHARTEIAVVSPATGRMNIPLDLDGSFSLTKGEMPGVDIHKMHARVASVPISGNAGVKFGSDRIAVNGGFEISGCHVQELMDSLARGCIPELDGIRTDAVVSMRLDCDGEYIYSEKSLPAITASINVPDSKVTIKGVSEQINLKLDASASSSEGKLKARIDHLTAMCKGLELDLKAGVEDLLEDDPEISLYGKIDMNLDDLRLFLPDTLDMTAEGDFHARINGKMRASHLDIYSFSQADISGEVTMDSLVLQSPSDSIDINIDRMNVMLGPETKVSSRNKSRKYQMMSIKGDVGNMSLSYGTVGLRGEDLSVTAMNSAEQHDTSNIGILGGRINARKLVLNDSYGTELQLKGTRNGFQMLPKKGRPDLPILTFTSTNDQIVMIDATNRAILTDAEIRASAAMNSVERKQRAKIFMDSLARKHPEIPRDSLMHHLRKQAASREVPEWLKEEDFRKKDIDIRLDKTLAKYFREWDLNGKIDIRTGILMTPYFPLRNILRGFEVRFDNDRIQIDSIKVRSGASEIGAKGKLTGLSRALLGRGGLKLDLDIYSDNVNANELLAAYSSGSRYTPPTDEDEAQEVSNAEFFKMVTSESVSSKDSAPPLIVIPSNLNAEIRLDASGITYSDLSISKLKSKLVMKERCVQLTGTEAVSNVGNIDFEGFYSTRTKKDIKAGFSFNFKDITAEKVIGLVPAADTLMPLLKSFNGMMNCEIAATAAIDTLMNVIPSSINGIIRIGGKDLSIKDSEMFRNIAKKLMFKNKKEGYINEMSVEGMISDSTLEIFPFIVKLDRYTLALSGIQNMDKSFRYHASLLRSPFLIRLGIDLYGEDFDKVKFKIGKAKYKNTRIPVFSAVIDTTKLNLVNSIRGIFEKGVETAVSENERRDAIEKHKKDIGYVRAVDQKLEELSEKEKREMENQEATMKETEEAEAKLAETIRQISFQQQGVTSGKTTSGTRSQK